MHMATSKVTLTSLLAKKMLFFRGARICFGTEFHLLKKLPLKCKSDSAKISLLCPGRCTTMNYNANVCQYNSKKLLEVSFPSTNFVMTLRVKNKKLPDPPIDYLPFSWTRKLKNDHIAESGDIERSIKLDKSLPKPNFELSETLKNADEKVKNILTLKTGKKGDIYQVAKRQLLEKIQQHPQDFCSPEVKIALMTLKVRQLIESGGDFHKGKAKDFLLRSIHYRNKLLNKLRKVDLRRYNWVLQELKLKHTPASMGVPLVKYSRKSELRRLTKEYCTKLRNDKVTAYHEELKRQQQLFVREKEEIMSWIAKEEAALGLQTTNYQS